MDEVYLVGEDASEAVLRRVYKLGCQLEKDLATHRAALKVAAAELYFAATLTNNGPVKTRLLNAAHACESLNP